MNNYYSENGVADKVVRSMYKFVKEDGTGKISFKSFLNELRRNGIHWLGKDFNEVMFEIGNRHALRDSFRRFLSRHLDLESRLYSMNVNREYKKSKGLQKKK